MASAITIDALEIVIEKKSSDAAKKVTDLASALKELKSSLSGNTGKNFATLAENLNSFTKSINKLDITKLTKMANALTKLAGIKNLRSIVNAVNSGDSQVAKEMIEEQAKMATGKSVEATDKEPVAPTTPNTATAIDAKDVNEYLDNQSSAKVIIDKINLAKKRLVELFNMDGGDKTSKEIVSLTDQILKLEKQLANLQKISQPKDTSIKSIKTDTKEVNKFNKAMKNLGKSLLRVAGYRAIRALLKAITSAFKEGIDSVYTYSRLVGGEFASSMDSITTSVFYLKNSIGAALVPVIQSLEPIITQACDLLASFATQIGAVAAIVSGKSVFTVATKQLKQYVEYANKAQNLTLGIDELNTVSNNDKTDYSTLFTEEDTENASEFAKALAEIIASLKDVISNMINILVPIIKQLAPTVKKVTLVILTGIKSVVEKLSPLLNIVATFLDTTLVQLTPYLEKALVVIGDIIAAVTPFIGSILQTVSPIIQSIVDLAIDKLMPIVYKLLEIISSIFGTISNMFPNISNGIGFIVELAGLVVSLLQVAFDRLMDFAPAIQSLLEVVDGVFGTITSLFTGLMHLFTGQFDLLDADLENLLGNIKKAVKGCFANIANIVVGVINGILTGLEWLINKFIGAINSITGGLSSLWSWLGIPEIPDIKEVSLGRLYYYANGGFPSQGQLFVANEAGAEMVGSMDGKTAVANNQEIVEGIKVGVFEAMMEALSSQDGGGNFNITVDLDGRQIESRISSITREKGLSLGSGVVFG